MSVDSNFRHGVNLANLQQPDIDRMCVNISVTMYYVAYVHVADCWHMHVHVCTCKCIGVLMCSQSVCQSICLCLCMFCVLCVQLLFVYMHVVFVCV